MPILKAPYKSCFQDPAVCSSYEGRLGNFMDKWISITLDPFVLGMMQGHLLQFN